MTSETRPSNFPEFRINSLYRRVKRGCICGAREWTVDLGLNGARVLVTAGASNIGRGIVRGFAAGNARIAIADIDGPQSEKVRDEAMILGGKGGPRRRRGPHHRQPDAPAAPLLALNPLAPRTGERLTNSLGASDVLHDIANPRGRV